MPCKLSFKTDMVGEEQEDNNETNEVRTLSKLDSFPIATVTNYHKFSGLKEHSRFILLQF